MTLLLCYKKNLYAVIKCFFSSVPAATMNIEAVASPLTEGDGTGVVSVLRLTTSPTATTLNVNVEVSIAVMTGGSETAVGEKIP